jgi:hypothetical protein
VRHFTLIVLLSAVALVACAQVEPEPRRASPSAREAARGPSADSCLTLGRWALGPILLDTPVAATLSYLGAPRIITRDSSEDDGGKYHLTTYHYDGLEFDEVRGVVDRVLSTSAAHGTPWGVRVGLTRAAVVDSVARFGVVIRATADTVDVPDCGAPSAYLTLMFDHRDRIGAVELAAERP